MPEYAAISHLLMFATFFARACQRRMLEAAPFAGVFITCAAALVSAMCLIWNARGLLFDKTQPNALTASRVLLMLRAFQNLFALCCALSFIPANLSAPSNGDTGGSAQCELGEKLAPAFYALSKCSLYLFFFVKHRLVKSSSAPLSWLEKMVKHNPRTVLLMLHVVQCLVGTVLMLPLSACAGVFGRVQAGLQNACADHMPLGVPASCMVADFVLTLAYWRIFRDSLLELSTRLPAARHVAERNLICCMVSMSSTLAFFVWLLTIESVPSWDSARFLIDPLGDVDLCVSSLAAMYSTRVTRSTAVITPSPAAHPDALGAPHPVAQIAFVVERANGANVATADLADSMMPAAPVLADQVRFSPSPPVHRIELHELQQKDSVIGDGVVSELESNVTHAHTPAARKDYQPPSWIQPQLPKLPNAIGDEVASCSASRANHDSIALSLPPIRLARPPSPPT